MAKRRAPHSPAKDGFAPGTAAHQRGGNGVDEALKAQYATGTIPKDISSEASPHRGAEADRCHGGFSVPGPAQQAEHPVRRTTLPSSLCRVPDYAACAVAAANV